MIFSAVALLAAASAQPAKVDQLPLVSFLAVRDATAHCDKIVNGLISQPDSNGWIAARLSFRDKWAPRSKKLYFKAGDAPLIVYSGSERSPALCEIVGLIDKPSASNQLITAIGAGIGANKIEAVMAAYVLSGGAAIAFVNLGSEPKPKFRAGILRKKGAVAQ